MSFSSISKIFSVCGWPVNASHPVDSTMQPTNFDMALFLINHQSLDTSGNEEVIGTKQGICLIIKSGMLELL